MELKNVKILISDNLNGEEENIFINLYRKYYIKYYGYDFYEAYLKVVKNIDEPNPLNSKINGYAKYFNEAYDIIQIVKENSLILLFKIYILNELKGFVLINKKSKVILDIILDEMDKEEEKIIERKVINYLNGYFKKLGYSKMYLRIPLKNIILLKLSYDLGFIEEEENIHDYYYLLTKNINLDDNQIIIINKEQNYTSRDVINRLTNIIGIKKIGHTGTLDPLATGVLVCLTGKYTKLVPLITNYDKEYIAEIKLGITTDTGDITGSVIKKEEVKEISKILIEKTLNSFLGKYIEEIPLYSAVHVNGKRLYEYAHENIEVTLPTKEVYIKEIELLDYQKDIIKFRVLVSKGTYIRSLIASICEKLNICGTMNSLIRTKQGNFLIENAYSLEEIKKNYKYFKLKDVLDLNVVELSSTIEKLVMNGNLIKDSLNGYILYVKNQKEVALYEFKDNLGKLIILFN